MPTFTKDIMQCYVEVKRKIIKLKCRCDLGGISMSAADTERVRPPSLDVSQQLRSWLFVSYKFF